MNLVDCTLDEMEALLRERTGVKVLPRMQNSIEGDAWAASRSVPQSYTTEQFVHDCNRDYAEMAFLSFEQMKNITSPAILRFSYKANTGR